MPLRSLKPNLQPKRATVVLRMSPWLNRQLKQKKPCSVVSTHKLEKRVIDCEEEVQSRSGKRVDRIRQRARKMRVRVRYGQRELKRISRTATLGGLFLSFLKIGLVGSGGGLAVIAQIRTLTVRKRHWLNEFEFAKGFALA